MKLKMMSSKLSTELLLPISSVRHRSRRTFSTHFEIFRPRVDGVEF